MWNRINPSATLARLRKQGPQLAEALPELAQNAMKFLAKGGALPSHSMDASGVEALKGELRSATRKSLHAAIGGTAWVVGALLYGLASLNGAAPTTAVVVASSTFVLVGFWGWFKAFR